MSLILDALNKADRERDARDSVPDLNTVHPGGRSPSDHRRLLWIAGALGLLVLILVALVLVLWLRSPSTKAPAGDPPVAQAKPVATDAAPSPTPAVDKPPAAVPEEVKALYETQTDPVARQVVEPEVKAAPQVITPETPRQSTVDEALARALWEETKRQIPPPLPLPQQVEPAKSTSAPKKPVEPEPLDPDLPPEETLAGYAKTPFLHELPITVQDKIPTLIYAKHDYSQRKVMINKTELRMGDATNGGVLVEKVLADGVLLSFNGNTFKLASLSSWVNY